MIKVKRLGYVLSLIGMASRGGASAGNRKRICRAVGSSFLAGKAPKMQGSTAEPLRADEAICGYLLPGRRGFFRTAGVCGQVSPHFTATGARTEPTLDCTNARTGRKERKRVRGQAKMNLADSTISQCAGRIAWLVAGAIARHSGGTA